MRRLLIPFSIAAVIAIVVAFQLSDGDDGARSNFGSSGGGSPSGASGGSGAQGDLEFPPIESEPYEYPPNEILIDPPPIEEPPEVDPRLALSAMPGATWVEIEDWFSDRADLEQRLQACAEILEQLPRTEALDRLLTLANVVSVSRGRAEFCVALADLLIPSVFDAPRELLRFRRILTKGKNTSERFVALPIVQMDVKVNDATQGVIEAYELAFFSVVDGEFAEVLLSEIGAVQSPTRALRLVHEAIQRGSNLPGNGYFEAAVLGAKSILEAETLARRKISSGKSPPGSALRREYLMADRIGLRDTLLDEIFDGALDGRRTADEFFAAIQLFRDVSPNRVDALRAACEQPELRGL